MSSPAAGDHSPGISPVDGLSHVVGNTDLPLIEETIPAVLKKTVARFPDREAAVFAVRKTGNRFL